MKKNTRNIIIIVSVIIAVIGIVLAIVLPLTLRHKDAFYTVTFNSNGGTEVNSLTNVPHGSTITEPTAPTREAYVFDGWFIDEQFSYKWKFDSDKVVSDLTLYAKWTYNPTSGLEFRKDGETYVVVGIGSVKNTDSLVIPDVYGNLPVVAIDNYAFQNEKGIKSVFVPASIKSVGEYVFDGCEGLVSVTFAGEETTLGFRLFRDCSNLEKVILPSKLKEISNEVFYMCGKLHDVVIPSAVTKIGSKAFYQCESLQNVTFSEGLLTIEENAFSMCKKLLSVNLPASLRELGNQAFSGCISVESMTVERGNTFFYSENNCIVSIAPQSYVLVAGCKNSKIPANSSGRVVNEIGYGAFTGCSTLISTASNYFVIPSNIEKIGDYAFSGCTGFERITVPASVTEIGEGAFIECEYLESVFFGSIDNMQSNLKKIGAHAFSGCYYLDSFTIPATVESIGWGAFRKGNGQYIPSLSFAGTDTEFKNVQIGVFGEASPYVETIRVSCANEFGVTVSGLI